MEKRHNYVRKVAETAVQLFITNDRVSKMLNTYMKKQNLFEHLLVQPLTCKCGEQGFILTFVNQVIVLFLK